MDAEVAVLIARDFEPHLKRVFRGAANDFAPDEHRHVTVVVVAGENEVVDDLQSQIVGRCAIGEIDIAFRGRDPVGHRRRRRR